MVEVVTGASPGAADVVRAPAGRRRRADVRRAAPRHARRSPGRRRRAVHCARFGPRPFARRRVRPVPPSLEDVFIARLGGKESAPCVSARSAAGVVRCSSSLVSSPGVYAQDAGNRFADAATRPRRAPSRRAIASPKVVRAKRPRRRLSTVASGQRPDRVAAAAGYTRTNHVPEFIVPSRDGSSSRAVPGRARQLSHAARPPVADLQRRTRRCARAGGARGSRGRDARRPTLPVPISGSRSHGASGPS